MAVRRQDTPEAVRLAKDLAGVQGDPSAWPRVLAAAGMNEAAIAQAAAEEGESRAPLAKRPKSKKDTGLTGFYDRNPKVCLTATVTVSTVAGVKINEKYGPQTPLELQPSTFGGIGLAGLALLARQMGWRRTAKLSLAGAAGQGLATVIAHVPEGSLMAPKKGGPKT